MGAILGKASQREREALRSYGLLFGLAFQMIDDWLDGCGNQEVMGKPNNQDVEKITFLSLLGSDLLYQNAESIVQKALESLDLFPERSGYLKEAAVYVLQRVK